MLRALFWLVLVSSLIIGVEGATHMMSSAKPYATAHAA